ncbi:MAG: stage II sporulation protein M [Polyangiaceae bacterium]|nr:stage II sporulation protein M [Polyangiaceae bacterium]
MVIPQDVFVAQRKNDWHELDILVGQERELYSNDGPTISRMASLYRSLCSDLVRCQSARYTPDLTGYLNGIAGRAHSALYGARPIRAFGVTNLLLREFPASLRKNWRFFLLSTMLFVLPWIIGQAGTMAEPSFAKHILPAGQLEGMAQMYSKGFDEGRAAGVDAGMAGFYVMNNVGVALRCFATGITFGLGSVFFLVYNGLMIGTVTGWVWNAGYGGNILTFMCGHAPFELTAILISGAAGLRMGYALVDTKGVTRVMSLRSSAREIAALVLGAAAMLVIAAAIEGFWSPSSLPPVVKWIASGVFSLGVAAFLIFAGREKKRA